MRNISITIILSLICCGASAQVAHITNILNDPVDYSRIVLPTDEPAYPALFVMNIDGAEHNDGFKTIRDAASLNVKELINNKQFFARGQLIHTWDIPPEFVEQCIQDALKRSGIGTREELARMIKNMPVFRDFDYDTDDWMNDMFTIVSAVVPTKGAASVAMTSAGIIFSAKANAIDGLGAASTFANLQNGFVEAVQGENGFALFEAAEDVAGEAVEGKFKILGRTAKALSYAQVVTLTIDAVKRDWKKGDNWIHLSNMRRIDYFYHLVNMELRVLSSNKYKKVWVVSIPDSYATIPVSFRGETCSMTWHLKAGALKLQNLPKKVAVEEADFDGEYFGYFNAVADFDLTNYDENYIDKDKGAVAHIETQEYKGLVSADDPFRSGLNTSLASSRDFPYIKVEDIKNEKTSLSIKYKSPIRIRLERPPFYDDSFAECRPSYLWDFYDNDTDTESIIDKNEVMKAMGLSESFSREGDVIFNMNLYKAYTLCNDQEGKTTRMEERVGVLDTYTVEENGVKTTEKPLREISFGFSIPMDIPEGTLYISWGTEIKPEKRSPIDITEEQWKPLLEKYRIHKDL